MHPSALFHNIQALLLQERAPHPICTLLLAHLQILLKNSHLGIPAGAVLRVRHALLRMPVWQGQLQEQL